MRHAGNLRVVVDDQPPNLNVRLAGDIDLGTAPILKQAVDAHARTGQTITIDLRDVGFIDSMGLAALVRAQHRAAARGASLQLIAPPERVLSVFRLTRLDRIFLWVDADTAAVPAPAAR
jgi:anti-sigma B factor antagonist